MTRTTSFDIEFQNKVFRFDPLRGCLLYGDIDSEAKQRETQETPYLQNVSDSFLIPTRLYAPFNLRTLAMYDPLICPSRHCYSIVYFTSKRSEKDNDANQENAQDDPHLQNISDPFLLQSTVYVPLQPISHKRMLTIYAKTLTWLCRHCYPIAYWISKHISLNAFANSQQAILFYRHIYPSAEKQRRLCLPRAIFAATTSRKFKQYGVMLIGAFLPSTQMHAWVIEDNQQPDLWDNEWICYKPVYILYHQ